MDLPESRCLLCQGKLNDATSADMHDVAIPKPGDASVCFYCGNIMIFDETLSLRGASAEEYRQVIGDEKIRRLVTLIQTNGPLSPH